MIERCKNCGHRIVKYLNWSIPGKTYGKVIWWHYNGWLSDYPATLICQKACRCPKPEPFPVDDAN